MHRLALAIMALALTPPVALAQSPSDSWERLKHLPSGHKVKLVDASLKAWEGRLVSVTDEAITVLEKRGQQEITIERAEVLRVTDLERSRRGRNAVTGLLVGILFYAAANRDSGDDAEYALFMAMFGGIGSAIGAAIPHPRPAGYRAKPDSETVATTDRDDRRR